MQDHFTKWIEGAAVPTKAAMIVADVLVHEWVYKHSTPLNLHSDRGTEFTAAMHRCMCDFLRIHKTYSTAYNPQSNGAVERCNRTLLSLMRTVVSEQQNDWMIIYQLLSAPTDRLSMPALESAHTRWFTGLR